MATLLEIWFGKNKKQKTKITPVEWRFYNPIETEGGDKVRCEVNNFRIDTLDYAGINFKVKAIREVKRTIGGKNFFVADYDLLGVPLKGEPVSLRLRLIPLEQTDGSLAFTAILLKKLDTFGYNQEYHQGLAFENNQGEAQEGDKTYWRVNDEKNSWQAKVALLSDDDKSGKVDENEVKRSDLTYWDFYAKTEDADKKSILEYYIVEMDGYVDDQGAHGSGEFTIWIGPEINQERISVY